MRSFTVALAIAAFAGLTIANTGCKQTPNSSPNPSGNAIKTPGSTSEVPVGTPFDITWQPTTSGTVSIVLLRGPSTNVQPIACIVDSIPNTGSYSWTPSTSLDNDKTHYGIQIIVDGTGEYQYSTQFGVSNPEKKSGSAASQLTSTTTIKQKETKQVYQTMTTFASSPSPTLSAYHNKSKSKSEVKSTFSHFFVPVHAANYTVKPTHTKAPSSFSQPTVVSAGPQNTTLTNVIRPSSPITSPSSLEPVQTAITYASAPVPPSSTVNVPASTPSPTTAKFSAAGRVAAGGFLAGLGAVVALFL